MFGALEEVGGEKVGGREGGMEGGMEGGREGGMEGGRESDGCILVISNIIIIYSFSLVSIREGGRGGGKV